MYSGRDRSESNVEKINQIISSSNFDDLTPETLLLAYQEEGFRSLEDLTVRLTEAIQDPKGRSQRLDYELFSKPTPGEAWATIEHKVPKIPFIVNGIEHDPEDIVRYNGRELCFIVDARSEPNEMVVLTDKAVWSSFLQTTTLANQVSSSLERYQYGGYHFDTGPSPASEGPVIILPPPKPPYGRITQDVYMYSQTDWTGSRLELGPSLQYPDLTSLYIWWPLVTWNDEIMSISPTTSFCIFGEHIGFDPGSKLWFVYSELGYKDLEEVGWNDRISSVWNAGYIKP